MNSRRVTIDEVLASLQKHHSLPKFNSILTERSFMGLSKFIYKQYIRKASYTYALRSVLVANEQLGNWQLRELLPSEVKNIILPHHVHPLKEGSVELVTKRGLTVEQAVKRIKQLKNYSETNTECYLSLKHAKNLIAPIFLSDTPIDFDSSNPIGNFSGEHLYHIDGLHRLIANQLDQKRANNKSIKAYVAVKHK